MCEHHANDQEEKAKCNDEPEIECDVDVHVLLLLHRFCDAIPGFL